MSVCVGRGVQTGELMEALAVSIDFSHHGVPQKDGVCFTFPKTLQKGFSKLGLQIVDM